jgi:uncharacterized protein (DUF302 family)
MEYHITRTVNTSFEETLEKVEAALAEQGFGVLTEIDVAATLKKKLDVEFRPYRILGACNPKFAYQALQGEDKIGTLLPCNVVVQQKAGGAVEVSAMNPLVAMEMIPNPEIHKVAEEVTRRLRLVVDNV